MQPFPAPDHAAFRGVYHRDESWRTSKTLRAIILLPDRLAFPSTPTHDKPKNEGFGSLQHQVRRRIWEDARVL
jgi:hypothetical protein